MRLVLALLVLLPGVALTILTVSQASSQWSSRQSAQGVARQATGMQAVALARAELIAEGTPLETESYGRTLGLSPTALSALLRTNLSLAIRRGIDPIAGNRTFRSTPTLRADDATFLSDVPKVLSGTVDFAQSNAQLNKFLADLENQWLSDYNTLQDTVTRWQPPGAFEVQIPALRQTFQAFVQGGFALQNTAFVMTGTGGPAANQGVVQSVGEYTAATQQFIGHLGPKAQAAWAALGADKEASTFRGTLQVAIDVALRQQPAPWVSDPALSGRGMTDGLKFLGDLSLLVGADSADLHDSASAQASAATWNFVKDFVFLFLLVGVSLGGVVIAGRTLTRPLKKLAGAAHRVGEGEFDLELLSDRGPREVVATNAAFNDMAPPSRQWKPKRWPWPPKISLTTSSGFPFPAEPGRRSRPRSTSWPHASANANSNARRSMRSPPMTASPGS